MNIAEIEQNVHDVLKAFSHDTFIYDLLAAYGKPQASISRLKNGSYNLSKTEGEVIWKKVVFFRESASENMKHDFEAIQKSELINKHNSRFVIVTDFKSLLALDTKTADTLDIKIKDLINYTPFFLPWAGIEKSKVYSENPADVRAAMRMAKLYDAICKDNPEMIQESLDSLNVFLSRLLFCFFAEDTSIFDKNIFTDSIKSNTRDDGSDLRQYIENVFKIMNVEDRTNYPGHLQVFPYVNGGLFRTKYDVPNLSRSSRNLLIECGELNWSEINPDIFGSMIQSVAHPDQRSSMGMHYTSVTNIMKVREPLFLNELYDDFTQNKDVPKKLEKLLDRLYNLKVFDPACGSGNFLIIAYKKLRELEMDVFERLQKISQQRTIPLSRISLSQFYGIEIDKFAHEMAILSLWLAEHQMNLAFAKTFGKSRPTLPLKEAGNIVCGNATRLNWSQVCPKTSNSEVYILGNPPYLGYSMQNKDHKEDMDFVFHYTVGYKNLDYIACWFFLASKYIKAHRCECAFVSTNSIFQGEQVSLIWKHVLSKNLEISFAHQSFKWTNNAKGNAGVTCCIIGLRNDSSKKAKYIYVNEQAHIAENISPYLTDNKNIFVEKRKNVISSMPKSIRGNGPVDGGNLILSDDEKNNLIQNFPESKIFIKKLVGSQEFINGINRGCLWIEEKNLELAISIPSIKGRIEKVRAFRQASNKLTTVEKSNTPHQFGEIRYNSSASIIIPRVSSERRKYIPIGFLDADTIILDSAQAIYDAEPWVFGVISSRMHMTWMRTVAGRLENRYRYSSALVYNTFPIPELTNTQKETLKHHVFRIIEEREKHSEKTLAQLYDPDKMPAGLREAHQQLDLTVERFYQPKLFKNDEERLECLFRLYEKMVEAEKTLSEDSVAKLPRYHSLPKGQTLAAGLYE